MSARCYDAQVGQFIIRDTYLDHKPYLYCEHDSINALASSGHYDDGNPFDWGYGFNDRDMQKIAANTDANADWLMTVGGQAWTTRNSLFGQEEV